MSRVATTSLSSHALFAQYIDVVNRAIARHRQDVPYEQLLAVGDKVMGDRPINVSIASDDADHAGDDHTVAFDKQKFEYIERGHSASPRAINWKVTRAHIEHVVEQPEKFIENPALLDLDWLKTQFSKGE